MKQFLLASPGPLRDKLIAAVFAGKKTATSSLLSDWQAEKETLPRVGEKQSLVNSEGRVVGVIEITDVKHYKLGDIDWHIVHKEGEDFKDVIAWRKAHEMFWLADTYRPSAKEWQLPDDTVVVVEYFKLLEKS